MSNSIRVSPKHGLNATIPVCFFCGKLKNEIVMLGQIKETKKRLTEYGTTSKEVVDNDVKAPTHMVVDYNPCNDCMEKFKEGDLVVEVSAFPLEDGRPPIQGSYYPTGRHILVRKGILNLPENSNKCLMSEKEFEQMFGQFFNEQKES